MAERSVRGISDELWQAAQDKAAHEGRSVSDVVGELLARWVAMCNCDRCGLPDDALIHTADDPGCHTFQAWA